MSHGFECKCCDYKGHAGNDQVVHQEPMHGCSNNEDTRTTHETCCQDFQCERCIDEAKAGSELIVHKETSHEDFVTNGLSINIMTIIITKI